MKIANCYRKMGTFHCISRRWIPSEIYLPVFPSNSRPMFVVYWLYIRVNPRTRSLAQRTDSMNRFSMSDDKAVYPRFSNPNPTSTPSSPTCGSAVSKPDRFTTNTIDIQIIIIYSMGNTLRWPCLVVQLSPGRAS